MKTILRNLAITMAVIALAAAGAMAENLPLKVTSVKGTVTYESAGKSAPLTTSSSVKAGDRIKTTADSEASIAWGDGNIVKVYPLSIFSLDEASLTGDVAKNSLNLESGKIFAKAKKLKHADSTFTIKTPTARAGVRGSEIFVAASDQVSNFAVLSGAFQVEADGLDLVLNQNFQLDVSADPVQVETAQPEPISQEQLEEMKIEAEAVVGEMEEQAAAPAEAAPAEATSESTESATEEAEKTVQDTIDETVINDTITNEALDTSLQELEAGMGGVNITIE